VAPAGTDQYTDRRPVDDGSPTKTSDTARARLDGRGGCFIEVGDGMAAYGEGHFFAFPEPRVSLEPASAAHKRAKQEFERILDTWFVTEERSAAASGARTPTAMSG
jgi:hypothetical protein